MKPIWLIIAIASASATNTSVARADKIDTEHLFGFTLGTDVGDVGEKELEGGTTGRFGKRSGSYSAIAQTLALEYTPAQNLRVEVGVAGAFHHIIGVPELDDRRRAAFDGLSFDARYRLLDRAHAPFGLAINAEPHWGRVDETSGQPVDRYGLDLRLAVDKELIPNRIVAAFNLLYMPEVSRSRVDGTWSREATVGIATALMVQARPGFFVGTEARYLRSYDGLGLARFDGHALFVGPSMYAKLSEHSWIVLAWSVQIAGRSIEDTGALDLTNFERHQATLKFGVAF